MGNEGFTQGRRSVLKSTGAALASAIGVGTMGTVSARPSKDEIPPGVYRSMLKRREAKNWTSDEWRTALAEKGYNFSYADSALRLEETGDKEYEATTARLPPVNERGKSGGVGTQQLKEDKAWIKLTYTRGTSSNHINFTWSNDDPLFGKAEKPNDFATVSFSDEDYDWDPDYDVEYGPEAGSSEAVSSQAPTYRCAAYDANAHLGRTYSRTESYMDAHLTPTGGTQDTRKIYAEYTARYEDIVAEGVSIGTGAGVVFGSETGFWRAESFQSEEAMDAGETYVDKDPA